MCLHCWFRKKNSVRHSHVLGELMKFYVQKVGELGTIEFPFFTIPWHEFCLVSCFVVLN